jgi:hypothetical protein
MASVSWAIEPEMASSYPASSGRLTAPMPPGLRFTGADLPNASASINGDYTQGGNAYPPIRRGGGCNACGGGGAGGVAGARYCPDWTILPWFASWDGPHYARRNGGYMPFSY